jgi:hypothetical protein
VSVEYNDDEITSVCVVLCAKDPKLGGRHIVQPFGVLNVDPNRRSGDRVELVKREYRVGLFDASF